MMTPLTPDSTPDSSPASGSGPPEAEGQLTRLLASCSEGDEEAFGRLIPLVYADLKRIAHRRLRGERPGHTLNTTAVVHEAYVQLVDGATATWRDRAHFFAVASTVIRHVLIDYARRRDALKRGGDRLRIPLSEDIAGRTPRTIDLLALDEALEWLAERDEKMARIVECRFFGGMTMDEAAEAAGVPLRTAERAWTRARAHLYRMLSGSGDDDS